MIQTCILLIFLLVVCLGIVIIRAKSSYCCVVAWTLWFLTSMVVEAVRGQKHYGKLTLWHFHSMFGSSLTTISQILEPRLKVLISSIYYNSNKNGNKQTKNKQIDTYYYPCSISELLFMKLVKKDMQ